MVHRVSEDVSRLELDLRLSTETSPTSEETCRMLTGHLNENRCGGGSQPRLGVGGRVGCQKALHQRGFCTVSRKSGYR